MFDIKWMACLLLLVSVFFNVYLYKGLLEFHWALVDQWATTSYVEKIFLSYDLDSSISNIERKLEKYGVERKVMDDFSVLDYKKSGVDLEYLQVGNTTLFFRDGDYYGSKIAYVELSKYLSSW